MFPEKAPIVEINNTNIDELWPCILLAIRSSTFVALDTELSGLGSRRHLQARDIEDRYKSISNAAKTRSILSLGLSCFKYRGEKASENGEKVFLVQTFNILTLCSEDYIVEPGSVQFLVEHGFDFNKQYAVGVKYQRGTQDEEVSKEKPEKHKKKQKTFRPYLKMLIEELIACDVAIILHNALLDLVFLYSNFYCHLPSDLTTFVSDLSSMFKGGIFDTKVIAEFKLRMQASFLEYVYKKCLKENVKLSKHGKSSIVVEFLRYPKGVDRHLAWVDLTTPDPSTDEGIQVLCQSFSNHGWCVNGSKCKNSHNVDLIIQNEYNRSSRSKKQKLQNKAKDGDLEENPPKKAKKDEGENDEPTETDRSFRDEKDSSSADDRMHRAGFDAFMTGLSFSVFITKFCRETQGKDLRSCPETEGDDEDSDGMGRWSSWGSVPREFVDKVYLSGKDFPLQIALSSFSRPSKSNLQKLQRLRGCDQQ